MSKKHENRGASMTRLASKLAGRHEAVKSKSEEKSQKEAEAIAEKQRRIEEDMSKKHENRGASINLRVSKAADRNETVKSKSEEMSQKVAELIAEKQRRLEEDMSKKHENRGASMTRLASKLAGRHEA